MDAGRFAAEAVPAAAPCAALMRRLDEASAARIVFIEAPAGFGKTVSARLWLAGRDVNARWLSLDAYDDAPAPFYQQLCAAVASAEDDGPSAAASASPADPAAFAASPIEHAMMLARTLRGAARGDGRLGVRRCGHRAVPHCARVERARRAHARYARARVGGVRFHAAAVRPAHRMR